MSYKKINALDAHKINIVKMFMDKVSYTKIAEKYGVSRGDMMNFVKNSMHPDIFKRVTIERSHKKAGHELKPVKQDPAKRLRGRPRIEGYGINAELHEFICERYFLGFKPKAIKESVKDALGIELNKYSQVISNITKRYMGEYLKNHVEKNV